MCFKRMKVILIVCIVVQLLSTGFTFAYSRNNAILYADNYSQSPNQMNSLGQGYNFYGWGSDCANFASQCMNAGSFGQDSYWYSTVSFSSNVPHRTDSYTWRVSQSLKEHLKNNGKL